MNTRDVSIRGNLTQIMINTRVVSVHGKNSNKAEDGNTFVSMQSGVCCPA